MADGPVLVSGISVVCTCGREKRRARKIEFFEWRSRWIGEHCGDLTRRSALTDWQHAEDTLPGRGDSRVFARDSGPVWRGRCRTCQATGDRRGTCELPAHALVELLNKLGARGYDRLDLYDLTHRPDTLARVIGDDR